MPVATSRSAHEKKRSGSNNGIRKLVVPIVMVLVGIGVLLYPVVFTQWNNIRQQNIVKGYTELYRHMTPAQKHDLFAKAERYNRDHTGGPILDPWLARISKDNKAYQDYLHILGDGTFQPMSQLFVPSANINLPVYHGSDDYVLQRGVGHLFGSSLPIGGPGTHAVLTGHTGLTNATMFDNLTKVKKGDFFYLNTFGRKMKYEVNDIRVVLPTQTNSLRIVPGKDLVTLVTCTPYGINTHRLLVTGTRVPLDKKDSKAIKSEYGIHWQWWMVAALAISALALILLGWWVYKCLRRGKKAKGSAAEGAQD